MDALLLIGAAAGDVMQSSIYVEEIAHVRSRMSDEGLVALERLDIVMRVQHGFLTGPALALFFSAAPVDSIDDVIESAADPVARLEAGLRASPYWDEAQFEIALGLMPTVHALLVELRDSGFESWYPQTQQAAIDPAVERNRAAVSQVDLIPEQQRLLGRRLDPTIEILVVAFAKPYGIRIVGQRFIAYHGWDADIQLRIAAHELFHPPFDAKDPELDQLLEALREDPWVRSIVEDHDPKYGYNSFDGILNEDSAQALDQIVSERLGFAQDPRQRWRDADGGMHMLAAALYHAMHEDGFAKEGGVYGDWLKSALARGLLSPGAVVGRAAAVVGQDAVGAWGPQGSPGKTGSNDRTHLEDVSALR